MAGHFIAGQVLRGVEMRRPLDVAELHFICGVGGAHIHGETDLEEFIRLMPISAAMKFQPAGIGVEADDLLERAGRADFVIEFDFGRSGSFQMIFDEFDGPQARAVSR